MQTVRVAIVADGTFLPIPHAHVTIASDSRTYDGYADSQGVITFEVAFPDDYHLSVDDPDFRFGAALGFHAAGAAQTFRILGTRSHLSTIAAVTASHKANAAAGATPAGAAPEIAGGVGPSLGSLPVLGLGSNGDLTINSHGPSTTSATLNGAPIFPSGSKLQLGLLDGDIFSSAAVGPGVAGAPDGTLALNTNDPSIDWVGIAQQRDASYGNSATTASERGTAGRTGYSFQHANSVDGGSLGNRYFLDQSGQFYQHSNASSNESDALTVRYPFGLNDVAYFDAGRIDYGQNLACTSFTALLPCGFGTDNSANQSTNYFIVRDFLTLDRATVGLQAYGSRTDDGIDEARATSFGRPSGYTENVKTNLAGYTAKVAILVGPARELTIDASAVTDSSVVSGSFEDPSIALPPSTFRTSTLRIGAPVIESKRLSVSATVGDDSAGSQQRVNYGATGAFRVDAHNTIAASARFLNLGSAVYTTSGVSPGQNLAFDCDHSRALGSGPTLGNSATPTSSSMDLSLQHTGSRGNVSIRLSQDIDLNDQLNAVVAGAVF
jgi:hypothetical protein